MDEIKRAMGIEIEFGINVQKGYYAQVELAAAVVAAYKRLVRQKIQDWDPEHETPESDLSGHHHKYRHEGNHREGTVLRNGARYYVDMAHPEYSTPVCGDPLEAVIHDKAGELIVNACREIAGQALHIPAGIVILKNNSDLKGNSYGCHENMLIPRSLELDEIIRIFVPFFCSRQVLVGAGKFGDELLRGRSRGPLAPFCDDDEYYGQPDSSKFMPVKYQISQRADFIQKVYGIDTTRNRPIINTRDEPHADNTKYTRLHIIVGDSNMSEWSAYLKIGTFALVAELAARGVFEDEPVPEILEPVKTIWQISRDLTIRDTYLTYIDGQPYALTALDIQEWYLERAERSFGQLPPAYARVLTLWREAIDALRADVRDPKWSRRLDWMIKRNMLEHSALKKFGRELADVFERAPLAKLAMQDLWYHDIDPENGLYNKLVARGLVERLIDSEDAVTEAIDNAPRTTRSFFISECLKKFDVDQASWDSLIFKITFARCNDCREPNRDNGVVCGSCGKSGLKQESALLRLPLPEPHLADSPALVEILERARSTWDLIEAISDKPVHELLRR